MKYINSDYIVKNVPSIEGWNPYIDSMSGALEWSNGGDTWIYATPNWNEDGEIPFDISNEDGDYTSLGTLILRKNSPLSEQLNTYVKNIKNSIKIIDKKLV